MKMKMKRMMGLFLALVMSIGCLSLNPIASYANDAGAKTFNINDGSVNITQSGNYTINGTGQTTPNTISVTGSNITATITLNNVNIDASNQIYNAAFCAKSYDQSNVYLTIKLKGTNSLKSAAGAGLMWCNSDKDSMLEIKGDGSLTATGAPNCAGIGGGSGNNITIAGGTVTATGGAVGGMPGGGAGIGGGSYGSGENITITGGTVIATGGTGAAGIGGGYLGSGKNITITGGSVKASSIGTTPTDDNGHSVYLAKLENQDGVNEVTVDSGTENKKTFTRAGNHPGSDTAFYLYLTGKDHVLVTSKGIYKAKWNSDANAFSIMKFDSTHVKSMSVTAQPSRLSYTGGENLALDGLVVTLEDKQGVKIDVPFADFDRYTIKADPANKTPLTVVNHNNKPVTLTITGSQATAETKALTVKAKVCTVTFKDGDKTQTVKVENGKAIATESMPANPTKAGYTFKEWNTKEGGEGDKFTGKSVVNGDMTVHAIYTEDPVSVSASADAEDPSGAEAAHATAAMYRLYNPYTHEHLFTTDKNEYDMLVAAGWTAEGSTGKVAVKQGKGVYRLYNPTTGEHHYTTSEDEVAACVKAGWVNEGIHFYSVKNGNVLVYSMYNPYEKKFYHHYASDPDEIARMVKAGWVNEGIKWYESK